MSRKRALLVVELLALALLPLALWSARSYQSSAQVRMLFWHPQGKPNIPGDLASEDSTRRVLLSSIVRERVERRLPWKLSEQEYIRSLSLDSNRHDWSLTGGVHLKISAVGSTPERSMTLCNIASEEFSGRCQELSQEFDDLLWEMQVAKVRGPLEQWRYQHKVPDDTQLEARAQKARQRLQITIAATLMELRRKKDGTHPDSAAPSEKSLELVKRLRDLEAALDDLWLQGVSNENVTDLKVEQLQRQQELQASLRADQFAALDGILSNLEKLKAKEAQLSPQAVAAAIDEFQGLQSAVAALNRAKDLALAQMSMYCLVFRKAKAGTLLAASLRELLPALVLCLILLVSGLAHQKLAKPAPPAEGTGPG